MRSGPQVDAQRILITGGAGSMASLLRPRLARRDRTLRLLDARPIPDPGDGEEVRVGSVTDPDTLASACAGVDAVIHLAGEPTEAPWEAIVSTNIDGTRTVLEACRSQGVPRVILASSNHAVGLVELSAGTVAADTAPAPDSYYGFSKAAIELLGRLYQQRFGTDVVCLRIGRCVDRPRDRRSLVNWLSPADAARLVEAALTPREPAFRIVWGVSANTRSVFDQSAGAAIGYRPTDDAERYAADLDDEAASSGSESRLVGGHFADRPLGVRPGRSGTPTIPTSP